MPKASPFITAAVGLCVLVLVGCKPPGTGKTPAQNVGPINLSKGFSKPVPLAQDSKPMTDISAVVDFNFIQHIAFSAKERVHLLHTESPGEGESEEDRRVYRQEFEGSKPQLALAGENLFLGVLHKGDLKVFVLAYPPMDAPEEKLGEYNTVATHELGKVKSFSLGYGSAESVVSVAYTTGKGVHLAKLTPTEIQPIAQLGKGKKVEVVASAMDAKGQSHVVWNEKVGDGVEAQYASFDLDNKPVEKPFKIADREVPSFLFSQSSQVHFASTKEEENVAAFSLLNDWMDQEIKGISPSLDEMATEKTFAYEGAGDACDLKVRLENSNFYGHIMWLDQCGSGKPSLGYGKVDLKEEQFILAKHHLINGEGLAYDFTFDAENYLNLFYSVADRGQYILYLTTYANTDELPKASDKDKKSKEEGPAEVPSY